MKAVAAFAELKTKLAATQACAIFLGHPDLVAIAKRHGMECFNNREGIADIDQSYWLEDGGAVVEMIYVERTAAPSEHGHISIYLFLTKDGETVEELEFEDLRGALG